jgi:homocysteine S-methyltransferase
MAESFAKRLERGVLIGDGAMGTMLYSKGIFINQCFDELNLTQPEVVKEVHRAYLDAGSDFIETNTFGANRFKLEAHGLSEQVTKINRAGALIAREEAGDSAFVGGSIGPLGVPIEPIGRLAFEEARELFRVQAKSLEEGGVDFFLLETFRSLDEIREAIRGVREASDKPLFALMSITDEDISAMGDPPEKIARSLDEWEADVIGLNCSVGPQPMLKAIEVVRQCTSRPLCVMPNAGMPRLVEGRFMYLSSPEYFAKYARRFLRAGVRVLGGCCGTTPEHIKAIARAARSIRTEDVTTQSSRPVISTSGEVADLTSRVTPTREKSNLAAKLAAGRFVSSVELSPPKSPDPSRVLKKIGQLKEAGVDVVNIPDGARASARMSSLSLAVLAEREVGMEVILHYCCRDRNLLGMQSDLLGAGALGIKNVLIVTGDPPKLGDYPDATAVFDVDAIGLMQIANRLNHAQDLAGNPIDQPTKLHLGAGANPAAINFEEEIRRFQYKVEAGAEFAMTQPVYDARTFEKFIRAIEHCHIPILVGILPLRSYRNAEFLSNEVPGMEIPESILARMAGARSADEAKEEGIRIAQEALLESAPLCQGVYVMPPFGNVAAALQVLEVLPQHERAAKTVS